MSLENLYSKFVKVTNDVTEKVVGRRKRIAIQDMTEETAVICEERRSARRALMSAPANSTLRKQYNDLNKQVKRVVRKEKTTQLENKIKKLEDDYKNNKSNNLFRTVRELEGKAKKVSHGDKRQRWK